MILSGRFFILTMFLSLLLLFTSCSSYKKITYFKNISDSSYVYNRGEIVKTAGFRPLVIQPDDILQVTISTLDAESNGALNLSASGTVANMARYPNLSANGASLNGYLVSKRGTIELPILGTVHVEGLNTDSIKTIIEKRAAKLFNNPVVNVRLINFKITVLGEVLHPGTYVIDGERANILDALGLAGDMTIYGKRDNVLLMRKEGDEDKRIVRFDLNDSKALSSPYFNLRQGDVLYVEPVKGKAAATDMSATRIYALAGAILSVLIVTISRISF